MHKKRDFMHIYARDTYKAQARAQFARAQFASAQRLPRDEITCGNEIRQGRMKSAGGR